MQKKRVVAVGVSGIALLLLVIFGLRFVRSRDSGKISKTRSTVTESTVSNKESEREIETGDGFNTDDLDAGVVKESKAQGGLAHRADEEVAASSESSVQETYAETDADGKNLTEPAQTIPTVETGLSESQYGQIAESVHQQDNAVITDTKTANGVGKDVNDAISAIQADELREFNEAAEKSNYDAYLESYWAER
jgi:hypothetical protein